MNIEDDRKIQLIPSAKGVEIGRERRPKIVSIPTSECVLDGTILKSVGIAQAEDINHGIQGHYLASPLDTLVVKGVQKTTGEGAKVLVRRGMEITAELWERQTGVKLLSPTDSHNDVIVVPQDQPMARFTDSAVDLTRNNLLAPALFTELVAGYADRVPELSGLYNATRMLAGKNRSMEFLAQHGIPVPETIAYDGPGALLKLKEGALDPRKRYVIKPDGGVGGIGVRMNGGSGYSPREVIDEVARLRSKGELPERFQLQEFVSGKSLGAVSVFKRDGSFSLMSAHEMVMKDGRFCGIEWTRNLESEVRSRVNKLFARLASIDGLPLLGPIGFDLQYDGSRLVVIEVNPRLTGASPVGILLSEHEKIAQRNGGAGGIESVYLDITVGIPEQVFKDPRGLRQVFLGALHDVELRGRSTSEDTAPPMILPQGLSPFDTSKIMFVNDADGALRESFAKRLQVLRGREDK